MRERNESVKKKRMCAAVGAPKRLRGVKGIIVEVSCWLNWLCYGVQIGIYVLLVVSSMSGAALHMLTAVGFLLPQHREQL